MNNILLSASSLFMHSLGWTLLYSLWQGLLIYAALFVLLKCLKSTGPQVKYYLSLSALGAMLLWFADTWMIQWQRLKGITVYITRTGTDAATTYAVNTIPQDTAAQSGSLGHYLPLLEKWMPLIVALYVAGLAVMCLKFVLNLARIHSLKTKGILPPQQNWLDFAEHWQREFNIVRPVKLFLSEKIHVPMMIGALKPVILLPVASISHLTTEQLEAIILHELAHIRRHDYLLNILQTIAETLLFFNPFVWFISRVIRTEREHCCDEMVVASTQEPLPYASALAMLENYRISTNGLAMAATGSKNQLFNRIKRIMEMKRNNTPHSQYTVAIVAVMAIMLSIAWFTPSFAQKKTAQPEPDTTQKSAVHKQVQITINNNGKVNTYSSVDDMPADVKKEVMDEMNNNSKGNASNKKITIKINDDGDEASDDAGAFAAVFPKGATMACTEITKQVFDSVTSAMKNIDWDQIGQEIKDAASQVQHIDWDQINREMKKAQDQMSSEDWQKVQKEINNAMEEVRKELKDGKMADEVREKIEDARKEVEKARREAEEEADKESKAYSAKNGEVHSQYDGMLAEMERDGLIDRSEGYKVKKRDGELFINGVKQPPPIYNKYKHYMNADEVTIKGSLNSINISTNN